MSGPPYPIPNAQAPAGSVPLDNVTGAPGCGVMASYTPITTAGTQTQTTGRASPGGIFIGVVNVALGTGFTIAAYDVVTTGTATATYPLIGLQTATAIGQSISAGPVGGSVGVRFLGTLVYVTSGTAGAWNALWD